jgi:ribonuclease E
MTRRMLIDSSHAEQTRVVIMEDDKLLEFDSETGSQRNLKGNIYLAKVTRVEPSLQAAFVDYGGNRHGFLPFSEIHPDYYRIPVADREALLAEQARARHSSEFDEDEDDEAVADDDEADDEDTDDDLDDDEDVLESNDADLDANDEDVFRDIPDEDAANAPLAAASDAVTSTDPSDSQTDTEGSTAASDSDRPRQRRGRRQGNGRSRDDRQDERRRNSRLRRSYTIQEVIKRGQIMLVQVVKEERGTKGAAVTTYLSLAGRYCVLMPNTARGGGISRKITVASDRKRLKGIVDSLDIPGGMAVIVRTAGIGRSKPDIKRDFDYLAKTWEQIREVTLQSRAPALIYEESQLIKRVLRDSYSREIEEVLVQGEDAYREAKDFMKTLMPSHAKRVQPYRDSSPPLFHRFKVDAQLEHLHSPIVQLRSGGYLVINLTEALVAIDVNSGRATRERHIEETALKTNLEAADEIARQLRLRDLAGLVVVDFIDMEDRRNNAAVERRFKDALRNDRARVQTGRISQLGLLEMSRQRLRPSLVETMMQPCPHCSGTGMIHSTGTSALYILRALEDHGLRGNAGVALVTTAPDVAFYILNDKRDELARFEQDYNLVCRFAPDASLIAPDMRIEMLERGEAPVLNIRPLAPPLPLDDDDLIEDDEDDGDDQGDIQDAADQADDSGDGSDDTDRRRRGRRGSRRRQRDDNAAPVAASGPIAPPVDSAPDADDAEDDGDSRGRRRRRRRTRPDQKQLPGVAVFSKSALPLAFYVVPLQVDDLSQVADDDQTPAETNEAADDAAAPNEPAAREERPNNRRRSRRGSGRARRGESRSVNRSNAAEAGEDQARAADAGASGSEDVVDAPINAAAPVGNVEAAAPQTMPEAEAVAAAEPTQSPATSDAEAQVDAAAAQAEPAAAPAAESAAAAPTDRAESVAEPVGDAASPPDQTSASPEQVDEPAAPAAEPVAAEPAQAEPVAAEPAMAEPAQAEPAMAEPAQAEPALADGTPAPDQPQRPRRRGWWQRLIE